MQCWMGCLCSCVMTKMTPPLSFKQPLRVWSSTMPLLKGWKMRHHEEALCSRIYSLSLCLRKFPESCFYPFDGSMRLRNPLLCLSRWSNPALWELCGQSADELSSKPLVCCRDAHWCRATNEVKKKLNTAKRRRTEMNKGKKGQILLH